MLVVGLACLLSACANYQAGARNPTIRASYDAADQLLAMVKPALPKDAPLLVSTFVDIDRLTTTSTMGRMLAEQVASRFTQQGYGLVELKLRGNVFVQEGRGELLLSREVKDLSLSHNVQAVIVGSYAVSAEKLFLNLKIVRPLDSRVLSAHNIALDLDETSRAMLMSESP
ncbi:FlgO family outer membrane protein [Chitinimonas sp.]|uniref:FlgO family outer membrane protein n=1 Tax=Chitinimonas sp. TaxID=1934313 RepID=UPI0035B26D9B